MDDTPMSELYAKYEAEGLARGRERAQEKSYDEERAGNFARGFAEGYAVSRILTDVAERLLAQGLADDAVAEVTGLPPERVRAIAGPAR